MKYIDEYNKQSSSEVKISSEYGTELCIMKYEVRYPSAWEMPEYGEYGRPRIKFNFCGTDGGTVKYDNKWLSQICADISIVDMTHKYHSGDTFTNGRLAFQMFNDFSDYLIEVGDKEEVYVTVK